MTCKGFFCSNQTPFLNSEEKKEIFQTFSTPSIQICAQKTYTVHTTATRWFLAPLPWRESRPRTSNAFEVLFPTPPPQWPFLPVHLVPLISYPFSSQPDRGDLYDLAPMDVTQKKSFSSEKEKKKETRKLMTS